MSEDYVRLAVFDDRGTAFEALRALQSNGVAEANVWPVAPSVGWWNTNLGPHMVTVAKSRIPEARKVLLKSGLLNRESSEL
jgi:hypothetical protein